MKSIFHRMSLREILAPPVFPSDDAKTLRANLLNYALLANLALMACCGFAGWLGSQIPALVNGLLIAFAAVSLALRHWLFRGHVQLVAGALLTAGFITLTVTIARLGTIRVPATGFYVALIVAAGFLFDLGGMLLLMALSSLAVAALIVAENTGLLPRPEYAVTMTQWLMTTALFAAVGFWTMAALTTIRGALRRAEREVAERTQAEQALERKNAELQLTLSKVRTLTGMLPICSGCKKIRDDKHYWHRVEAYLAEHSEATFTHSYCPDCVEKYFPDLEKQSRAG